MRYKVGDSVLLRRDGIHNRAISFGEEEPIEIYSLSYGFGFEDYACIVNWGGIFVFNDEHIDHKRTAELNNPNKAISKGDDIVYFWLR